MIHIWRVPYFAYLHSILSRDLPRQLEIDIPRMRCTVNGALVYSVDALRAALGNKCFHAVAPFLTQASMAPVVRRLVKSYDHVLESGSPLCCGVTVNHASFQIDVSKLLILASSDLTRKQSVLCTIHVDSEQDHALISCDKQRETYGPLRW